jgi:hypothetical protein
MNRRLMPAKPIRRGLWRRLELRERAKRRSFRPSGHLNKIKGRDYSGTAIQAEAQKSV